MQHNDGMDEQRSFRAWFLRPVMHQFAALSREIAAFNRINQGRMERQMATTQEAMDRMTASVERSTTVAEGFMAFNATIIGELRKNAADPAAINALADKLEASTDKNAAAMEVNTPADPSA